MPVDNEEVKGPSDSGAEKNNVGAREESNAFQSERTEDLFKERDERAEKSEGSQAPERSDRTEEQASREKLASATADAAKTGDPAGLEKGIKSAFEDAKGDASKFKDFGDKLGEKLKDSGIKVDTKDSSISLNKDGKSVTYSMNDQIDLNSGNVSADVKSAAGNGQNPGDVVKGFADQNKEKNAQSAEADKDAEKVGVVKDKDGPKGPSDEKADSPAAERTVGNPILARGLRANTVDKGQAPQVEKPEAEKKDQPAQVEKPEAEKKDQPAQVVKPEAEKKDQPAQVVKPEAEKKDQPAQAEKPEAEKKDQPVQAEKPEAEKKDQPAQVVKPEAEKKDQPAQVEKPEAEKKDQPVQVEKPEAEKKDQPANVEKPEAEKKDQPEQSEKPAAEKKPVDVLKDPKASPEDKLRAARDMAKNGENKFKGDDGREYRISTQKYGDREGVVVSTTDSKGKFMPVQRGLVDKNGNVSHQRDSSGKEVDYAGTRALKEIKNDAVLSTGKKGEAPQTKPEVKPEEQGKQPKPEVKPEDKGQQQPKPEVKPEEKGQQAKPEVKPEEKKEKPAVDDTQKGQGQAKPEGPDKPDEKPTQDNKDKPAEKPKGPLGTEFIPVDKPQQKVETIASVYAKPQPTASGRPFRPDEMTAAFNPAHLPKGLGLKDGDVIKVTHEGRSINVTLTDRGPYIPGRGIDLSAAAGRALGITIEGKGVGKITFEKIGREPGFKEAPRPKKK